MIRSRSLLPARALCLSLALAFGTGLFLAGSVGARAATKAEIAAAEKKKLALKNAKAKATTAKGKTTAKTSAKPAATGQKPSTLGAKTAAPVAAGAVAVAATAKVAEVGKPVNVQTYGSWGVFVTSGKAKTCYALAQPKERLPASLKREQSYVFISTRPAENVRNEISIIVGYDVKPGDAAEPKAEVGSESFALVVSGTNLWIKNVAQERSVIDTMRKGQKLVIKATSQRGNKTTDSYPLAGLAQALDRVQKECP